MDLEEEMVTPAFPMLVLVAVALVSEVLMVETNLMVVPVVLEDSIQTLPVL